jgi:hypothetical protein
MVPKSRDLPSWFGDHIAAAREGSPGDALEWDQYQQRLSFADVPLLYRYGFSQRFTFGASRAQL